MDVGLPVLAGLVAVAAAVRSTWSPCGLSMLSTITPLTERGKGHSYPATASWFVAGATAGGASLGLIMAGLALAVSALDLSAVAAGSLSLAAVLVAAGSDSGIARRRLPVHRRQVNERWLDRYRPWVYGAGFGWQIGSGLATYITAAAVYLMVVLAGLTGRPVVALAVGTGFGFLRGLAVLLTRHLTEPSALLAFHRRFFELGPWADRLVVAVELASAAGIILWLHTAMAAAEVGVAVLAVAVSVTLAGRRGTTLAPTCPVPNSGRPPRDTLVAPGPARRTG